MDQSLTPTLHLAGTGNEILDRNFRRIDDAFAAKAASLPLPNRPIDVYGSTPTIGLARTGDANLNHDFNLIDALFSAAVPTRHGFRMTGHDGINQNFIRIINAAIAAAIPPPPPDDALDVTVMPADAEPHKTTKKSTKKGWF
jgi:hypothetical protein